MADRIAVLSKIYDDFNARDVESVLNVLRPDVEWPNGWEGGRLRGRSALRDYWARQWAAIDPYVTPLKFDEAPDGRIHATIRQRVRDLNGALIAETTVTHTYAFEGDEVRSMEIGAPGRPDGHPQENAKAPATTEGPSSRPRAVDPLHLPETNATSYPAPFREANLRRWNRRIGDHFALTNFGVNMTRIVPGGQSSSRHWHSRQDEFVYVLMGEVVLEIDEGERVLTPGMCVGFAAGVENGHRFVNKGETDALLLVVGDRTAGDEVYYPDLDLHARLDADGRYRFTRKDGKPLD